MAEEPDLMTREIEEELRRERLLKLWDRYGVYAVAAGVALVLGVAGWQYYQYRQARAADTASTEYVVALTDFNAKRPDEAQQALAEMLAKAPRGYKTLARLRLAAYDGAEGNPADALDAYEQIVKDASVDPLLADFARLQIAVLKFDELTLTELRTRLSPLNSKRNPWRYSARELLGLGAAKAGKVVEAKSYFEQLVKDDDTPPGIGGRARVMVAVLTEQERAAGGPSATEKSDTAAKVGPGQDAKGDEKGQATPGNGKGK
jgi:hypothetical protein